MPMAPALSCSSRCTKTSCTSSTRWSPRDIPSLDCFSSRSGGWTSRAAVSAIRRSTSTRSTVCVWIRRRRSPALLANHPPRPLDNTNYGDTSARRNTRCVFSVPPWFVLEGDAEAELHHPAVVIDIRHKRWRAEVRRRLLRHICTEVAVIENVEHLQEAIHGRTAGEPQALEQSHVDAVNWITDKVVARHDRSVRTETGARPLTGVQQVLSVRRGIAIPRTIEIQPADLDAVRRLPDAV